VIPELGHFALILAFLLAIAQSFFGLAGAHVGRESWIKATNPAVTGGFVFVSVSLACLAWAFAVDNFSVEYVANNSNSALPMLFKISAVWGAHEGSLLLWIWIQAVWTLGVAALTGGLDPTFRARVLGVLGIVSVGFMSFTLATSNPFERLLPSPADGADLNPLLQDWALSIHPPMLYMGYVGTSVAFAFAVAALIGGRFDAEWAKWTRPWTLAAWLSLTIGIALGSWWAYYELGWGGWWFWDPVENASFMPWLVSTALIHSLAVTEKRGLFKSWTLLLAIFAFSLSILGTFLVRSGVLVSVHAFASDPARGMFILGMLLFFIAGSLLLYAWRAPLLKSEHGFEVFSREAFLLVNNGLLVAAAGLILVGTLWPLFMDAFELGKISVGPPYFNAVFLVPTIPLILLLGIGMHSSWKRTRFQNVKVPLLVLAALSLVAAILVPLVVYSGLKALTVVGFFAAFFIMASALVEPVSRLRHKQTLSRSVLGMSLAHFGLGMFVMGVTGLESYKIERDISLGPGETHVIDDYEFKFVGTRPVTGPNYEAIEGIVEIREDGELLTTLRPQKRLYQVRGDMMTEAGIRIGPDRDLFVALGEDLGLGRWSMRIQYKPLVRYIWLGALVMAIGGGLAALDRRYRIIADDAAKKADQALSGGGPTGRPVPGAASTSTAAQRGA
jgi:cytochrome c-type biogenesis protein CcmF